MSHVHTSVSASDVLVVRCASNPRFPQNYVANFAELSCGFLFVEEVESKPVKEHNAGEGDSFVHCIGLDLDRVPAKSMFSGHVSSLAPMDRAGFMQVSGPLLPSF